MSDSDFPAMLHAPTHFELVYVGPNGTRTECFGYPPRTEDISERRKRADVYCVQLVSGIYEVYDLRTIQSMLRGGVVSIGLPVFVQTDPDAAIMWALMNL